MYLRVVGFECLLIGLGSELGAVEWYETGRCCVELFGA